VTTLTRSEHHVSRKHINPHALKVLYRLHDAGFSAYLVGGSVRDLLLNKTPKDFDVATDAKPEQIKKLFRNCLLIGRRFRIAHVRFGHDIIEVTTFRAHSTNDLAERAHSKLGMLLRDNVYGTIEEDAFRRDFTVNALYYNIADFSIIDFTDGIADLRNQTLRMIGTAKTRYQEDPVRLLRAIRFAAKLDFFLHPETENPIYTSAKLLTQVPPARLFDEFLKLFFYGHAAKTYVLLEKYDLLKYLLPIEKDTLSEPMQALVMQALAKTDERVSEDLSVNPAFLLAIFLWHHYVAQQQLLREKRLSPQLASHQALLFVLNTQQLPMGIPKRLTEIIRDVWSLQWRFTTMNKQNAIHVSLHKRHRAAYDFLMLRAAIDTTLTETADWWTTFFASEEDAQQQLLEQLPSVKKRPRYKNKRKPRESSDRLPRTGQ